MKWIFDNLDFLIGSLIASVGLLLFFRLLDFYWY